MDKSLKLAEVYLAIQGEVNLKGIGAPALFVRLAGCHIRCYKATLGCLCDTPAFLKKDSGAVKTPKEIAAYCKNFRDETGVNLITLTGGDPLFNDESHVWDLLTALSEEGFIVSVETSGIDYSIAPYRNIPNVHWVVDWKTPSAGIPNADSRRAVFNDMGIMGPGDFVKFVVYGQEDYDYVKTLVDTLIWPIANVRGFTIAVGAYWGGPLTTDDIFKKLSADNLLGKVVVNFQAHKALYSANYSIDTNGIQL